MHMCIAFFVYLHLPASALPTLRARTRGFASAHFRPCERALSALRVRTLGPVSAHSRPRECALIFRPPHTCVWAALSAEWPICSYLRKKINIHAYFCMSMLAHVAIYS